MKTASSSTSTTDPKLLLQALYQAGAGGVGLEAWEPAAVDAARRLLAQLDDASAEAIAALPEALALAVVEGVSQQRKLPLMAALAEVSVKPVAKAAKKALYQLKSLG